MKILPSLYCSFALTATASVCPVVIGHRGYPAVAPENTLPSFVAATATQAEVVELDFRTTADGVLVVMHDSTLLRTTDAAAGRVEEIPFVNLHQLDTGAWFSPRFRGTRVPTLAEAVDLILTRGRLPLLERKSGTPAQCLAVLDAGGWRGRVIVQSFDWDFLRELHALAPDLALAALGPVRGDTPMERALCDEDLTVITQLGARTVVWSRDIDAEGIRAARERGLRVFVYTLNDEEVVRTFVALGADGIITDDPGQVGKWVGRATIPGVSANWTREMAEFSAWDFAQPSSAGVTLFLGTSSIRLWPDLKGSFPDFPVVNRGFGGAHIADCLTHFERLVSPHRPSRVVFYAGTNDITVGKSAEQVADDFRTLCARLFSEFPASTLLFIAPQHAPAHLAWHAEMARASTMIAEFCAGDPRLTFVDLNDAFRDMNGQPRTELYDADGLHLSPAGYAEWVAGLRPVLADRLCDL